MKLMIGRRLGYWPTHVCEIDGSALLISSALLATLSAISSGFKLQGAGIVLGAVSAGASLIAGGLKAPSQIADNEKRETVSRRLGNDAKALYNDSPHESPTTAQAKLDKLRDQFNKAGELPQPNQGLLKWAAKELEGMTELMRVVRTRGL
jgi:hypothetical protein